MGDARSYNAGRFLLSLDETPSLLKDFDGGNIKSEVATIKVSSDKVALKTNTTLKFEPFTINIGMSMGKPLAEWIKATLDLSHMRKNGYIVAANTDGEAMGYRHFRDALITEITVPALDAASKEPAFFTCKFDAEEITYAKGDKAKLSGKVNVKQKAWLTSNFRVKIGDMPCTRISKVDSFTIKQGITEDPSGEQRIPEKVACNVEFPNLKITFSSIDAPKWEEWFTDFCIKGNNGNDKELQGSIEFLSPATKDTLGTIDLFQIGIFSLNAVKLESDKAGVAQHVAELYVEKMAFNLAYV
jgi:hypothetical protein